VTGVGERTITSISGFGDLVAGNSTVGTGEREVVGTDSLVAVGASTNGSGIRTVVSTSTGLVTSASTSGIAERTIVSTSTNLTTSATTTGIAERIIPGSGDTTTTIPSVSGVGIRRITSITGFGDLVADDAVVGDGTRRIPAVSANLITAASTSGSGIRTVVSESTSLISTVSSVSSFPERIITSTFTDLPQSVPGSISGIAERELVVFDGLVAYGSSTAGSGIRTVELTTGVLPQNGSTSGVGLRTIVSTSTDVVATTASVQSPVPVERIITSTFTDLPQSVPGSISGIAERELVVNDNVTPYGGSTAGSGIRSVVLVNGVHPRNAAGSGVGKRTVVSTSTDVVATTSTVQSPIPVERIITSTFTDLPQSIPGSTSGIGERELVVLDGLVAYGASTTGSGKREVKSTNGDLVAVGARTDGVVEREITTVSGFGDLVAGNSVLGDGTRRIIATGTIGFGETSESVTYSVQNNGSGEYVIDGTGGNPTLSFYRGSTYTINVSAPGHPFWIKTTQTTGSADSYNDGVTNNGTDNGTITFVVPDNAPSTLYYVCQYHASMQGSISVSHAIEDELQNSEAAGTGKRTVISKSANLQGTPSVLGVVERTITQTADNIPQASGSRVDGRFERIITSKAAALPQSVPGSTSGVGTRTITITTNISQTSSASGSGTRTVKLITGVVRDLDNSARINGIGQTFNSERIAVDINVKIKPEVNIISMVVEQPNIEIKLYEETDIVAVAKDPPDITVKIKPDIFGEAGRIYTKVA